MTTRFTRAIKRRLAIAATLLAGAVIAASDPNTAVRREFVQAYAAANFTVNPASTGLPASVLTTDSSALQAYVLYPYIQAVRLRSALQQPGRDAAALDITIQNFLQMQNGAPATRELRRAWLLDLAARQQWLLFQGNLPSTSDAELRCLAVQPQIAAEASAEQASAALNTLRDLWLSPNRLPAACNAPFEWARSRQGISPELIEQRARLVLKAGNTALARDLLAMLPAAQAEPLRQWVILIDKPQQAIDALLANPGIKVEPVALQDGWLRLARKDQDAALDRLPKLIRTRQLSDAAASPYVLSVALTLSWSRRSEALPYFARVLPADMNDSAREWQVRAALWVQDWPRVLQSIAAMPEVLRTQARWRYWQARAAEQSGDMNTARALYQTLVSNDDNYFAAMAAARLKTGYAPHAQPLPIDAAASQRIAAQPGMQRARELLAVQLRDDAGTEWTQAFATLQLGEHIAAAQLAHDWGWHDQAVALTARLGLYNDYEFLYPQPYDPEVSAAAKLSGLSTDLIYGVMRQETLFRADARSAANARGLLQLLPETARLTARKFNLPAPRADDLYNPVVNVPLGAVYLKSLIDSFDGQVVLALAAYNAGPGAAKRWQPAQALDSDIWIENIPYNETRSYVQRILWHSLVFHWLRNGKPLDTQSWLAPVSPPAA